jgi:hypothetical protein
MPNEQIILRIVTPAPDPKKTSIIHKPVGKPAFKGQESVDLVCGSCGTIIGEDISLNNIRNVVVKCDCGAYNLLSS